MKKIYILIAGLSLVILAMMFVSKSQEFSQRQEQKASHSHEKHDSLYVCPMHPEIQSDKPGSCPICGMDLVPASELEEDTPEESSLTRSKEHPGGELTSHGTVILNSMRQQMIGVRLTKVEKKTLFKHIRAPGRVAFDPELFTAQSEYLEALKQWEKIKKSSIQGVRENTKQMIESSKLKLKILGLSDRQISQLSREGSSAESLLLSGEGKRNWVYADIFEADLPYLKEGQAAQIDANFLNGERLPGKLVSIDPVINSKTRTAKLRIQLLKARDSIRPESYVNVTVMVPMGEHLAIPLDALLDTGRETLVFIKRGEGKFLPKRVQVLFETEDYAAISQGVSEGEEVVSGANFMLDSESRLRAVIQRPKSHGHQPKAEDSK